MKSPCSVRALALLVLTSVLAAGNISTAAESAAPAMSSMPSETPAQHDARMKWWREARFGLFIHWGIYSVPAGTWQDKQIPGIGEWIMNKGKIPVVDYAKFAENFNPVKFDADAWVKLARDAGQKYIIITSKHHDGFAMFHSAASPYNIYDATPFKRDPLKELAAACQKYGIKLGFYYSQAQDWHQPGGAANGGHWDPAQEGNMDEYLQKIAVPQVKEILTNYGPIAVLWWDTPTDMTKARADLLAPLIALQPGLITNNRLGGGYQGDTETPENKVPATGYPRDWEACMTMNDTWGFKSYDHNWKSSETLIRTLVDIVSKGGNYLLNVGPTQLGEIPPESQERLRAVGAWLKVNGTAVYGTMPSPFRGLTWGRATQKPGQLFLHVFNWPTDGKLVVPMKSGAKKAYLLSAPAQALKFSSSAEGLVVQVPATASDAVSTTIVLEGVGTVEALPPPPILANAQHGFDLPADAADLAGPSVKVQGNTQLNLGEWRSTSDVARWTIRVDAPGSYDVIVTADVPTAEVGSEFTVQAGDQSVSGKTVAQGNGYKEMKVGTIALKAAGPTTVTLQATKLAGSQFLLLRSLTLKPTVAVAP